MSDELE